MNEQEKTTQLQKRAIELYQTGLNIRQTCIAVRAEGWGINESDVGLWLRAAGVPFHRPAAPKNRKRLENTPEMIAQAVESFGRTQSVTRTAREMHLGQQRVSDMLDQAAVYHKKINALPVISTVKRGRPRAQPISSEVDESRAHEVKDRPWMQYVRGAVLDGCPICGGYLASGRSHQCRG